MRKLKMKKTIGFLALILVGVGSVYAADPDPFATAASKITGMSSSMMDLFDVLIGVGLIFGGVHVFIKMKTGEGSEGKKALMNTGGALLFAIVIRVIIGTFIN
ncbi:MAG TPA: DUF4134 domain-containing protein [Crocinitomix sp.]|nr:DUF4134 domain-containing protein [Crocinitomix sp.]